MGRCTLRGSPGTRATHDNRCTHETARRTCGSYAGAASSRSGPSPSAPDDTSPHASTVRHRRAAAALVTQPYETAHTPDGGHGAAFRSACSIEELKTLLLHSAHRVQR
jgi:hypothetical protein